MGSCLGLQLPVPLPLFEVSSINHLVQLVARTTVLDASDVTQEVVSRQWRLLQELLGKIGLQPNEHLAVTLSPASKLLMVHLCSISTSGLRKIEVRLCAVHPLQALVLGVHGAFRQT